MAAKETVFAINLKAALVRGDMLRYVNALLVSGTLHTLREAGRKGCAMKEAGLQKEELVHISLWMHARIPERRLLWMHMCHSLIEKWLDFGLPCLSVHNNFQFAPLGVLVFKSKPASMDYQKRVEALALHVQDYYDADRLVFNEALFSKDVESAPERVRATLNVFAHVREVQLDFRPQKEHRRSACIRKVIEAVLELGKTKTQQITGLILSNGSVLDDDLAKKIRSTPLAKFGILHSGGKHSDQAAQPAVGMPELLGGETCAFSNALQTIAACEHVFYERAEVLANMKNLRVLETGGCFTNLCGCDPDSEFDESKCISLPFEVAELTSRYVLQSFSDVMKKVSKRSLSSTNFYRRSLVNLKEVHVTDRFFAVGLTTHDSGKELLRNITRASFSVHPSHFPENTCILALNNACILERLEELDFYFVRHVEEDKFARRLTEKEMNLVRKTICSLYIRLVHLRASEQRVKLRIFVDRSYFLSDFIPSNRDIAEALEELVVPSRQFSLEEVRGMCLSIVLRLHQEKEALRYE